MTSADAYVLDRDSHKKDDRLRQLCQVAIVAALGAATAAVASPAQAQTTLASFERDTPVRAYRDTIVFSAYDPASKRYRLSVRQGTGPIRSAPVAPRKGDAFEANVGRGPDGRPLVVYGDCPAGGRCGVYALDPVTNRTRLLTASRGRTERPFAVSVWRRQVAWAEDTGIYTAQIGRKARLVRPLARRTLVGATALLGHELALDLDFPEGRDVEEIQVQTLDGRRRHVVGHTTSGEGGQTFVGLSFSGKALYWTRVCVGDPSGCGHGVAYRYRNGRYAHARVPVDLAGFAVASSGVYWVSENFGTCESDKGEDATCDLVQTSLSFVRGHDRFDGGASPHRSQPRATPRSPRQPVAPRQAL